mmetsp:Transcript_54278/g.129358  ORF Transcript_54278/g.129358 Transcript_54278/m.129358 type:complete len:295 (+) Transcript_54278:53-937(+)
MASTMDLQAHLQDLEQPAASGLFHKTKLCKFYAVGACTKGPSCIFAHGASEINPLPDFHCTKICPSVMKLGLCDDPGCRFAHRRSEIRRRKQIPQREQKAYRHAAAVETVPAPGTKPMSFGKQAPARQPEPSEADLDSVTSTDAPAPNISPVKLLSVKTKMCKFHLVGQCCKGAACTYAHSQEELRPVPDLSLVQVGQPATIPYTAAKEAIPMTLPDLGFLDAIDCAIPVRSSDFGEVSPGLSLVQQSVLPLAQQSGLPFPQQVQPGLPPVPSRDESAEWLLRDGTPKFQVLCL